MQELLDQLILKIKNFLNDYQIMTKYIFNVTSFSPLSENEPKQMIILCHGYGGDGQDISVLANSWRRFLPDAIFLCPNAPEVCTVNPLGYQWFDMTVENDETDSRKIVSS